MFDWFFDFLYLLTRSIFKIIDGMVAGTEALCGMTPIVIEGQKTDFMQWMLSLTQVTRGFKITALVGIFLVVFFTIWSILKNIVSEKPEGTPAQLCIRAVKAIFTFLFIPAIMYILTKSLNAICEVLYDATRGGADLTLGGFLAKSFGQDCINDGLDVWAADDFDYTSFSIMWKYFNMRHYDYFFSWVAGITIIYTMSRVLFIFVERLFSIVLLYIIAPIPVAASILDEGQKFKQWREQLLAKYCVGYGAILGLNIYTIVISALCTYEIQYFDNNFVNFVFKLIIIIGGCFGVNKLVGMIGNLVANGAGDAAMQEADAMAKGVETVGKGAYSLGKKVGSWLGKKVAGALGLGGGGGGGDGDKAAPPANSSAQGSQGGQGGGGEGGGGEGGGEGGGGGGFGSKLVSATKGMFKDLGTKLKHMFKRDEKEAAKNSLNDLHKNKGKVDSNIEVGKGNNGGFTLGLKKGVK